MSLHFKILVPFYNIEKWAPTTIKSIKDQSYKNFQCIMINDISIDNSLEVVEKNISDDPRFVLVNNTTKKYVIENLRQAAKIANPNKQDVVVVLDGDDWFANKNVLLKLKQVYEKNNCWLTYGSYVEFPSRKRGKFAQKIPEHVIVNNEIRKHPWVTGHLQTFKYGLWENLEKTPNKCFKEPNTDKQHHFMYGWDLAWMLPLVELAGDKSFFIEDILYVYNRSNPLNCDKENHMTQLKTEQTVRNMLPYQPLEEL